MRTNIAGAARATGCTTNTITRWLRASERAWSELDEEALARRRDVFRREEVGHTGRRSGAGEEWALDLDALQRVHIARGGTYWQPEAAVAIVRLPPQVAAELARVADLERENEALRRQLVAARTPTARAPMPVPVQTGQQLLAPYEAKRAAELAEFRALPELPPGYVAVSTFCRRRNLDERNMRRAIDSGQVPQPDMTLYRHHTNRIRQSWSPEAQQEVLRYLAEHGGQAPAAVGVVAEFAET